MDFTHLHVHSHFSLLDGGSRIRDLVSSAKEQGMGALALTDHGNLFGAMEFYRTARDAGIKPILGMEAYIAPGRRDERVAGGRSSDNAFHLLLLAQNETGWRNLMQLSSRAFLEGFYYHARVDRELLSRFNEGLVCTTACLGGEVPQALLQSREARALKIAGEYRDIFGPDRFFVEIQNQGEPEQDRVNPMLVRLAGQLGVGIVGTNDVHFLRRGDKKSHEVLTCISTNKKLSDPDILRYSDELYLKSPGEMASSLGSWPEALSNTMKIAEMCDVKLDLTRKHLPFFKTPDQTTPEAYLRKQAWEGLARRFGDAPPPPEYCQRLERELDVIEGKGYSSYFLIIHDFVRFARTHDIPASPRGSGVATLLGYVLGISDVDPIRYGLIFERFTDPQRKEDPDVDIDICQEGRGRVLQYVRERYGHVAQIITYGTLKPRAAVRDVGRVLDMPLPEVDRLTKLIPEGPKVSFDLVLGLKEAKKEEDQRLFSPELKHLYDQNPQIRRVIDHARDLEGLARHAGVHAAGVVVCDEPLETLVPLMRQSDSPDAITQWDGPTCEKIGMMKMDVLGLKTLTVIQRAREMVRERTGTDCDPSALPLDDAAVFELFRNAETDAVFQFESEGMKNVLRDMQPNRLEDLIAANAMFRPGPMELIKTYCRRKKQREPVERVHPLVDDILSETFGIMVYQEQVMQVLNRLGGLPLSDALTLIKAISKKKESEINARRPVFVAGARANGISETEASRLFDLIRKFAGYGFNKAHATGYAIIAYQTAWFKSHFPQEFWAASLTYESDDQDKLVQYMYDARRMGIPIVPPDVNISRSHFTVDGDRIRFGLKAVKGVGDAAVQAILKDRDENGPFGTLFDFCRRVDLRAINRSTIEALVKCGAFDGCGTAHRAAQVAAIDAALQSGQADARDRAAGQMSLFGMGETTKDPGAKFPDLPPWSRGEIMAAEKETMGFFISGHPLDDYAPELNGLNHPPRCSLAGLDGLSDGTPVAVGAMVVGLRRIACRQGRSAGKDMAILSLEDSSGRSEAVVFPKELERVAPLLQEGALLQVRGTVKRHSRNKEQDPSAPVKPSISVDDIWLLSEAAARGAERLVMRLRQSDIRDPARMEEIKKILLAHPGRLPVQLRVYTGTGKQQIVIDVSDLPVTPSLPLTQALGRILGGSMVSYEPKPQDPPAARRWPRSGE